MLIPSFHSGQSISNEDANVDAILENISFAFRIVAPTCKDISCGKVIVKLCLALCIGDASYMKTCFFNITWWDTTPISKHHFSSSQIQKINQWDKAWIRSCHNKIMKAATAPKSVRMQMLHSFAPQANCGSNDLKLPTKLALETYH